MKKLLLSLLVSALGAVGALTIATPALAQTIDNNPDCDTVAIIKCGAFSPSELRADYDKNEYGDVPKVFSAFGISRSELNGTFENGVVWSDGRVTIDGKVVATNATTAGRWNNPKSGMTKIAGTERAYKMSTSNFVTDGQTAFVRMVDGKFTFAVIKSCGNPVTATPKQPEKPKPQPVYECRDLTMKKISRTRFSFTADATASNGATITKYRYEFGDGSFNETTDKTVTHTYDRPGTYAAKVIVYVTVNGEVKQVDNADCRVNITVDQPPVTPPAKVEEPCPYDENLPKGSPDCKEPETPVKIADTGPAQLLGAGMGMSSLTAAGYYWFRSRRNLMDTLLQR